MIKTYNKNGISYMILPKRVLKRGNKMLIVKGKKEMKEVGIKNF